MFLVNTRKRNKDKTFKHERMPRGEYRVYEFKKVSEGKEAKQRKLEEIPIDKDTLLLIHGFNNNFKDVTNAYLDFEKRIRRTGFRGNVMGFTWPSFGRWYRYHGDKEQVEYAALGLLNFLLKFRPRLRRNSLHVNTHSMGAYLLIRALVDYSRIDAIPEAQPGDYLVQEMTFFAADVSNNSLEKGENGRHAAREVNRLTSYFYRRDPVLGASAFVNLDGRLGLNGAERPSRLLKNTFQVDCTTLLDSHSGYRKNTKLMQDLAAVLNGRPSHQIGGRKPTGDKNTFRIGPELEEDDPFGDDD